MTSTIPLSFGTLGDVRFVLGDPTMSAGIGAHRLVIPLEVSGDWFDQNKPESNAPMLLIGSLWTSHPSLRWVSEIQSQVIPVRGFPIRPDVVVSISDDQLVALDHIRDNDQLALVLKIQATLLQPPVDIYPVVELDITLNIGRSRWLELLNQVGSEVSLTLRVRNPLTDSSYSFPPAADAKDSKSLAQAVARLRIARNELADHQWEHCVATCRRVLENVARFTELPSARSLQPVPPENRTQEQRWAMIYYDIKSMANAAHHDDETTDGFVWTRAGAEAILTATGGLLSLYAGDI